LLSICYIIIQEIFAATFLLFENYNVDKTFSPLYSEINKKTNKIWRV